jgi:hypothetical protein
MRAVFWRRDATVAFSREVRDEPFLTGILVTSLGSFGRAASLSSATGIEKWLFSGVAAMQVVELQ